MRVPSLLTTANFRTYLCVLTCIVCGCTRTESAVANPSQDSGPASYFGDSVIARKDAGGASLAVYTIQHNSLGKSIRIIGLQDGASRTLTAPLSLQLAPRSKVLVVAYSRPSGKGNCDSIMFVTCYSRSLPQKDSPETLSAIIQVDEQLQSITRPQYGRSFYWLRGNPTWIQLRFAAIVSELQLGIGSDSTQRYLLYGGPCNNTSPPRSNATELQGCAWIRCDALIEECRDNGKRETNNPSQTDLMRLEFEALSSLNEEAELIGYGSTISRDGESVLALLWLNFRTREAQVRGYSSDLETTWTMDLLLDYDSLQAIASAQFVRVHMLNSTQCLVVYSTEYHESETLRVHIRAFGDEEWETSYEVVGSLGGTSFVSSVAQVGSHGLIVAVAMPGRSEQRLLLADKDGARSVTLTSPMNQLDASWGSSLTLLPSADNRSSIVVSHWDREGSRLGGIQAFSFDLDQGYWSFEEKWSVLAEDLAPY